MAIDPNVRFQILRTSASMPKAMIDKGHLELNSSGCAGHDLPAIRQSNYHMDINAP